MYEAQESLELAGNLVKRWPDMVEVVVVVMVVVVVVVASNRQYLSYRRALTASVSGGRYSTSAE